MRRDKSPAQNAQRGFTLTEVAIVLGVIGLVLGGIWTAAAGAMRQNAVNTYVRDLYVTYQNVRQLYQDGKQTPTGGGWDPCSLAERYDAGVYPADFLQSVTLPCFYTTTLGPYITEDSYEPGSTYGDVVPGNYYEVDIDGTAAGFEVNVEDCYDILKYFSGVDGVLDITTAYNGWGPIQGGPDHGNFTFHKPLSASEISSACVGTSNYIWIIFGF